MPAFQDSAPLTTDAILQWFASDAKPQGHGLIGSEHEKFIYHLESLQPASYQDIANILRDLQAETASQPIEEAGNIIGLKMPTGASVTLEPGGQLELSGAPLKTLHQTCQEITQHIEQMREICEARKFGMLSIGYLPRGDVNEAPKMPKKRYEIMRRWMPKLCELGLDMMHLTTTVQVNLDYENEPDMAQKMRIGAALQPFVTALFSSSPLRESRLSGFSSMRAKCWLETDAARSGIPEFIFKENFTYHHWMDYLLDVPLYFINRPAQSANNEMDYIELGGVTFREFMADPKDYAPVTLQDFISHASTVFPDVRLKNFIEMRGADSGSKNMLCALPAFWVGLLYDSEIQQKIYEIIAPWSHQEVMNLRRHVAHDGMNSDFRGQSLYQWAETILPLAKTGLTRRGYKNQSHEDETIFLHALEDILNHRQTISEQIVALFEKSHNDVRTIYQSYHF